MKISNDIPTEFVLKYIVRERDRYKEKLAELVSYTKALEIRVQEMQSHIETLEAEGEVEKDKVVKAMRVKHQEEVKRLRSRLKRAMGQLKSCSSVYEQIKNDILED